MAMKTALGTTLSTKRLFVAVDLGSSLSESFFSTLKKLKINADKKELFLRWTPPENYHATVTFIGETDASRIPEVQKCIEKVCYEFTSFDLKIEDIGAFSHEHEARVLWAGVQNKRYLNELKNALDTELVAQGLIPDFEDREFVPHMTFARLRNPKSVKDLLSPFKRKSFGKTKVAELVLYESKIQGAFPIYVPILKIPLSQPVEESFAVPEQHTY